MASVNANEGEARAAYDADGRLTSTTTALGLVTSYQYDQMGRITKTTQPDGATLTYTYDAKGNKLTETDANGNTTTFVYDGNGNLTEQHNPDGGVERHTYDTNDQKLTFTDSEGYTTSYLYDGSGNLTKITDPRGNSKQNEYDPLDRMVKTTNEEGGVVELTYDAMDRLTRAVNEDGAVTEYTRDGKGRVTAIKDAHGSYRYLEHDSMDRVTADTDEKGVRRTYQYDAKGNLTKYTDGLGNSESYSYDSNDRLTSKTDKRGMVYTYSHDALNRATSETDPLNGTKLFEYDRNSRITAVTDRNGNKTTYKLDGNGNIVESIDATGHSSYFEYDSMDRMTKVKVRRIDTANKVDETQETLYTYDKRGLVKTEVNAKGDGKAMVYDGNGNLVAKTDEDGYVTEHSYSPVNLVSSTTYGDGKAATFLYDGTGDLVTMTDWNGETTFAIDLLDRLTGVNDHDSRTTGYTYDTVGNITEIAYPDSTSVKQRHDAEGNLLGTEDWKGLQTTMTYDANGNQLTVGYANGEKEEYVYNAVNQLVNKAEYGVDGKKTMIYRNTYDAEGNRTGELACKPSWSANQPSWGYDSGDWGTPKRNKVYSYDKLNRLVGEYDKIAWESTTYSYDSLGNLSIEKQPTATVKYKYNNLNQLTSMQNWDGTTNYTYDKRGNRIGSRLQSNMYNLCTTYEYDATNMLTKGEDGKGRAFNKSHYTYNALGVRVGNRIDDQLGWVFDREFVIDYTSYERNDIAIYASTKEDPSKLYDGKLYDQKNLYAHGRRLEMWYYQYTDSRVTISPTVEFTYNAHEDIMGSASYYTKQTGAVYEEHVYDAWGGVRWSTGHGVNDGKTLVIEPNYTGHSYDPILKIYHAEARFYDGKTRQWMASDPIKSGLNWYQYVGANPTTYFDPNGLEAQIVAGSGSIERPDVYIFYDTYIFNTEKEVIAFYGNVVPNITLVPTSTKIEYIEAWNKMPDKIDMVIDVHHSYYDGFLPLNHTTSYIKGQDFTNGKLLPKEIAYFALLGCNLAQENNIGGIPSFAQQMYNLNGTNGWEIGSVIASDGTVYHGESLGSRTDNYFIKQSNIMIDGKSIKDVATYSLDSKGNVVYDITTKYNDGFKVYNSQYPSGTQLEYFRYDGTLSQILYEGKLINEGRLQ